ncbi:hypothetical protein JHK86_018769 [Glycine max]|nr:hypothetical protein JHK86_018769 [Glycine max]
MAEIRWKSQQSVRWSAGKREGFGRREKNGIVRQRRLRTCATKSSVAGIKRGRFRLYSNPTSVYLERTFMRSVKGNCRIPKPHFVLQEGNKISAYIQTRADPKEIIDLFKKSFLKGARHDNKGHLAIILSELRSVVNISSKPIALSSTAGNKMMMRMVHLPVKAPQGSENSILLKALECLLE